MSLLSWMRRRIHSLRSGVWARWRSYSRRFSCLASSSAGVGSTRGFGVLGWGVAFRDVFTAGLFELWGRPPLLAGFGREKVNSKVWPIARSCRLRDGQRRTMEQRSDELPEEAWREITVAEGSQGPRSYLFSAQRVRPTSRRKPGEIHWAVYRRNRDGSEPRYYLSNAPEDTPLETLAYVGGSRWRIETEFETEKSDVGLDEYETRTWAGWHHHVALCLLGGAFLLSLQQAWGEKDAPDHEAAGLPGGAGNAAPGTVRANRVAAVA